jgi:uncharacterized membrane protein YkvA (DUF1232 family)
VPNFFELGTHFRRHLLFAIVLPEQLVQLSFDPKEDSVSVWLWFVAGVGVTLALWLLLIATLLVLGRHRDAREVARFVPDCVVLFKRLLRDPRVPRRAKVAVLLLIPYLVSPIDLVPDFIPVLGQLDDAILVAAIVAYVTRKAGPGVVADLWPGSDRGLRVVLSVSDRSGD